MYTSTSLVVFLSPLLALAAPQFGGPFDSGSSGEVPSSAASAPTSGLTSTTTAIATLTGTGSVTPSSTSAYTTTSPSNGVAKASNSPAPPADVSVANDLDLIGQLVLAAKAPDRIDLIPNDASFKFDFDNPPDKSMTTGKGGHTVRADRQSFPPLIGTGVSMVIGFLGPCGFNTPHTHPRSSEINVVVQGTLETEFTLENGARTVHNTLGTHQMTVFPQGALHTEFNPNCDDAIFVAGFASEDPGVQSTAQTYFGLSQDVIEAATGNDFTFEGKDVDKFRNLIPANVALGVDSCLRKCQIK
ncbi:MAG: hypothetical protein LQ346_000383 [Caloplaca aetnensis]|nr:MAG: hypothetical protein LQ346_000383 [Caloplaca aetnensis]